MVAATATVLSVGAAVPAYADVASGRAACTGLGISDHAVNDGPGTVAEIVVEIKGAAEAFGFKNSGQVVSRFSQVHAGTHVPGCEDAIFAILTTGP